VTTLRCTAKLLKRLGIRDPGEPPPPENRLGDWFANIIYTRQGHFLILVSERSLLPIVTTARDLNRFEERFLRLLRDVLLALKVPQEAIDRELSLMHPMYYGRTNSRVVLGSMTDFTLMTKDVLATEPEMTLFELSLFLAHSPCKPLDMKQPEVVAPELLSDPPGFRVLDGGRA
jgi:hypothetical protein